MRAYHLSLVHIALQLRFKYLSACARAQDHCVLIYRFPPTFSFGNSFPSSRLFPVVRARVRTP
ncbi:hypothetical protein ALQ60_101945 [Pseudomonas syringae pv. papulans]|nr:Unknown protein sequence [Pseudomonas syringae pv. syringae]KPY34623.1 hypothetical protein ALO65_102067 [Pseudomonas syringae pv. papulans]RMS25258.1 hypothetical protein ALP69_101996 [Pseudomonas syringae pv. aceris]RML70322.1 hypothetical protein ALQ91_102135 [Pseudomonas syringae pv. syringae]RMN48212.1 hypothetical protein ALQ60_101945 [Pseudomonas syringae pv. papulans]